MIKLFRKKPALSRGNYLTKKQRAEKTKNWPKYDADPKHCTGDGHRYCVEQGKHSWFNHSQDTFRQGSLKTNYPEGCEDR